MVKMTKRQKKIAELSIKQELYTLEDALILLGKYKDSCSVKFDETVEISCKLGIDPRHSDQMVRGAVPLPSGTGKSVKVAAFVPSDMLESLSDCGADIMGSDELVDSIKNGGAIEFEKCVAHPSFMPSLAKIGKILGPKGLMPNPKLGTVATDIASAISELKSGKVEFRAEKAGIVHVGVGKLSFKPNAIAENVKALLFALRDAKPSGAKGEYFNGIFLSTSMGPAIELDTKQLIS